MNLIKNKLTVLRHLILILSLTWVCQSINAQDISGEPLVCPTGTDDEYFLEINAGICLTPTWSLEPELAGTVTTLENGGASIQFSGMSYGGIEEVTLIATTNCVAPEDDVLLGDDEEPVGDGEQVFTKTIRLYPSFNPVINSIVQPTISGPSNPLIGNSSKYTLSRLGTGVQPASYKWFLDNRLIGESPGKVRDFDFNNETPGIHELKCVPVNECGQTNSLEMEHKISIELSCEAPVILGESSRTVCVGNFERFQLSNVSDPENFRFEYSGGQPLFTSPGDLTLEFFEAGTFSIQAVPDHANSQCVSSNVITIQVIDETTATIFGPTEVCESSENLETIRYTVNTNDNTSNIVWNEVEYNNEGQLLDIKEVIGSNGKSVDVRFLNSTKLGKPARLRVVLNGCSQVEETLNINVLELDEPPVCEICPISICQSTAAFFEVGSTTAEEFEWILPADVSIVFPEEGVTSKAYLSSNVAGMKNIIVRTASENCGVSSVDFSFEVEELLVAKNIEFSQSQLNNASTGYLYVNNCKELTSLCTETLTELALVGQMDVGEIYEWGNSIDFSINAVFDIVGYDNNDEAIFIYEAIFAIDKNTPRQKFYRNVEVDLADIRTIAITPRQRTYLTNEIVDPAKIRSFFYVEENRTIDVINANLSTVTPSKNEIISGEWEQTFKWEVSNNEMCVNIPAYQFQLLKIYDNESVDWSKALNIYTESEATELTVTIGEGSGQYLWRVRPIGSYPGNVVNPKNFNDNWTGSEFTYTNPDGNKNWIYSRVFTEGNKTSEQLTVANGLQQVKQQFTKIDQRVVGIQSVQDYAGRSALTSLPLPMIGDRNKLGYKTGGLINEEQNFNASDYDIDPYQPTTIENDYYSGREIAENQLAGVINERVPSAEGFPYIRSIYQNDGTGRVREQGGVGGKHHVGNKSTKTFFAGVPESELIMLFGDEAPDAANVHKVINIDANNIASISYQNKDGNVIATALNSGVGETGLVPINPNRDDIAIYESIDGVSQLGPFLLSTKQQLLFPSQRQIDINYEITPAVISKEGLCDEVCTTCNYQIEIVLHRLDPAIGEAKFEILGSENIPLGSICNGTGISVEVSSFTAKAEKKYVLEKRIYTDNNEFLANELGKYTDDIDNDLLLVQNKLSDGDVEGLKTILETNYGCDLSQGFCEIPVGCETLIIPLPEICEEPVVTASGCQFRDDESGQLYTFSGYLNLIGSRQSIGNEFTLADALYFDNQLNNERINYSESDFDQLIVNILTDYAEEFSCADLWDYWQSEIETYEFWRTVDPSTLTEQIGDDNVNFSYSLLDGFIGLLNRQLLENKPSELPDNTLCVNGQTTSQPFYFNKNTVYGRFDNGSGLTTQNPDLTRVHALIFYDHEDENSQEYVENLAGLVNPSEDQLLGLDACVRYQIALVGNSLDETSEDKTDEELINEKLSLVVSKCHEACDFKTEAFRQGIIDDIFQENPNTIIQHYEVNSIVSFEPDPNDPTNEIEIITYVGYKNVSINTEGFDLSECELDAMTDALVENCKSGYCELDLVFNNDGDIESVGTADQILNYQKVFEYDFDVEVLAEGESCPNSYDHLESSGSYWSNIKDLVSGLGDVYNIKQDGAGGYWIGSHFNKQLLLNTGETIDPKTYGFVNVNYLFLHISNTGEIINYHHLDIEPIFTDIAFAAEEQNANVQNVVNTSPSNSNNESPLLNTINSLSDQLNFVLSPNSLGGSVDSIKLNIDGVTSYKTRYFFPFPENNIKSIIGSIDVNNGSLLWADNQTKFQMLPNIFSNKQNRIYPFEDTSGNLFHIYTQMQEAFSVIPNFFSIKKRDKNGIEQWISDEIKFNTNAELVQMNVDQGGNTYLGLKIENNSLELYVNNVLEESFNSSNSSQYALAVVKIDSNGNYEWCKPLFLEAPLLRNNYDLLDLDHSILLQFGTSNRTNNYQIELDNNIHTMTHQSLVELNKTNGELIWANSQELRRFDDFVFGSKNIFTGSFISESEVLLMIRNNEVSDNEKVFYVIWDRNSKSIKQELFAGSQFPNTASYLSEIYAVDNSLNLFGTYAIGAGTTFDGLPIEPSIAYQGSFLFFANYSNITSCVAPNICFKWTEPLDFNIDPDGDVVYDPDPVSCEQLEIEVVQNAIDGQRSNLVSAYGELIAQRYSESCTTPASLNDDLNISYIDRLHHFTLYYYDRAGNLIKTVPPEGVKLLPVNNRSSRNSSKNEMPNHQMVTNYQYNSIGQLVSQNTPDGGNTNFWYNDIGQLRFSQNEKQLLENTYSYTKYDRLGRINEVGQTSDFDENVTLKYINDITFPENGSQKTVSKYTIPTSMILPNGYSQRNLRNRISYTYIDEDGLDETQTDRVYSIYSYDPHGNVEFLVQLVPGLDEMKLIEYEYDLISGNVLMVKYNAGKSDQFYHRYEYDVDNRITMVETSIDGHLWDQDAQYEYYAHGPLKRATIGTDKIQSVDYAYTIHGWLKAINDPSSDYTAQNNIQDVFAMSLNYYNGDYLNDNYSYNTLKAANNRELFNGNIAAWEMATLASDDSWVHTGNQYTYDELNRIVQSRFNVGRKMTSNSEVQFFDRAGFQAEFNLDGNGNLKTLNRNDIDAVNFDAMTYHLQAGNNKLDHVTDAISDETLHSSDMESQSGGNYEYDAIGNLVKDNQQEMVTEIDWTVYGKVDAITKPEIGGGTKFTYDANGNRVKKSTVDPLGNQYVTFYIRDASGNIMSTYRKEIIESSEGDVILKEVPIYGSDRIGVYNPDGAFGNNQQAVVAVNENRTENSYKNVSYAIENDVTLTLEPGFVFESELDGSEFFVSTENESMNLLAANTFSRNLDLKQYELKDHLSNVRAVLSDRRLSIINGTEALDFKPSIVSAAAYYPYGMDLPTVKWEESTVTATMESSNMLNEIIEFDNYENITLEHNKAFNHTDGTTSTESFLLTGKANSIIGLAKSLKVQAGDKVNAVVHGKYLEPNAGENTNVPTNFGAELVNALGLPTNQDGLNSLTEFVGEMTTSLSLLSGTTDEDPIVNAGLSWLLFDEDFVFKEGGFSQLDSDAAVANETDPMGISDSVYLNNLIIPEDGYLLIYTTNESTKETNVYFDDFSVTHEKLVEDDPHNPDLVAYRYGFNGKEKDQQEEWGLNAYDYGFRIYNPALGRFLSVDPLTANYPWYTPYQFAGNTPIMAVDLDGLEPMGSIHYLQNLGIPYSKDPAKTYQDIQFANKMSALGALTVPSVALDFYLTKGKVTKAVLNQFKTQVIANATIEGANFFLNGKGDASSIFQNTLKKSLKGVDGADAIIGVFVKNKKLANVLSSVVDLSINPETGEGEFKSLIKGKSPTDVIIDVAFNFVTDAVGDKIGNTKFSGPVKEALKVAGIDANNFLKDLLKNKSLPTDKEQIDKFQLLNNTVENDATRVAPTPREIDLLKK